MTKPLPKKMKVKSVPARSVLATPAEEARKRLADEPVAGQQPPAPPVAVPAVPPTPSVTKTTIDVINDRLSAMEERHASLLRRVLVLEGHIAEIADAMLYSSGVLHAPPKIAEAARRIVTHHQDKIRR